MLKFTLKTQLLDIVSLTSEVPRSSFSEEEVENLANNFLEVGGNIKPVLVERLDFESFKVIEGHLEFYSSVRAREINDDFEMISGIILDRENEEIIRQQYSSLSSTKDSIPQQSSSPKSLEGIASLEKNLLSHLKKTLSFEIEKVEANLSRNLEQKFDGVKILIPRDEDHLKVFNEADFKTLIGKLKSAGFKGKRGESAAAAIIQERDKGAFLSFSAVVERVRLSNNNRAITEKSMIVILDAWNRFIDVEDVQ